MFWSTFGIGIFVLSNVSLRFKSLKRFETFDFLCSAKGLGLSDADAFQQCVNYLLLEAKFVGGTESGPLLRKPRLTQLMKTTLTRFFNCLTRITHNVNHIGYHATQYDSYPRSRCTTGPFHRKCA